MRNKVYSVLAAVLSWLMVALSVADGGLFAYMVWRGGAWQYLLFTLSLVGAAALLAVLRLKRQTRSRSMVLCLLWLFANACIFLLLPAEGYLNTVAALAPVDWLFKVVPYFFAMVLTAVTVTQTMGTEE